MFEIETQWACRKGIRDPHGARGSGECTRCAVRPAARALAIHAKGARVSFQSIGLYGLFASAAALAAGVVYHLRARRAEAAMRRRLEAQLAERERAARELHDTLLQGIQGLILRFQAVAERIPSREPAREMMERALERADEVLVETRDRVYDVRDPASKQLP